MEKGWQQVVACLAVLEAGAAFLPINMDQPDVRIGTILADARVPMVLTVPALAKRVANALAQQQADAQPAVHCVDRAAVLRPAPARSEPPAAEQMPADSAAYVIYTSGSTGTPKGVAISHRAALNTLEDLQARFGLGAQDRVLWVSDLSFDLSIFDLFGVLGAGGAVVLPAAQSLEDPERWVARVAAYGVTVWNSEPQLADMAVSAAGSDADLSSLRLMMLSGDWLPVTLPDRVRSLAPACAIYSLGGATEAAIWSILYPVDAVDPDWTSIPYGKPLTNQSFHVLREDLSPCPVHVPGRLFIGGAGLAIGYLGDAQKTAERFVPHPETGERLYDTGDLGRYLPSGDIVFLGRADLQVKIRGHRVELAEVEAALMSHPDVEAAVAVAIGTREDRHIAAYVVPTSQADAWDPSDASIIQAPAERAAFTLAGHGRPPRPSGDDNVTAPLPGAAFDTVRENACLARQSYRTFQGEVLNRARLEAWLAAGSAADSDPLNRAPPGPLAEGLSSAALGSLMGVLQAMTVPEALLTKRRYASAGSLYPVRAYLMAGDGIVSGLAAGAYAYDPIDHALIYTRSLDDTRTDTARQDGTLQLVLVGHLPAIAPLYGRWATQACVLEAGGMVSALAAKAGELGLAAAATAADAQGFASSLGLTDPASDVLIAAVNLGTRVDADGPTATRCSIQIEVKPGGVVDLPPGLYRYDTTRGLLPSPGEGLPADAFRGPNRAIHAASSLSLAIIPPAASGDGEQSAALLAAGALAQGLAEAGVAQRIGVCPVGGIKPETLRAAFARPATSDAPPYMLLAGPVSAAQQTRWSPTQLKASDPRDPYGGRTWLAERLPSHMIPTAFTVMSQLPLTPSGKVDRKALPQAEVALARTAYAPPRSDTEKEVAAAFADVLGLERIGRDDGFFVLGGHSLMAVRLVARLDAATGKTLPIRTVFEAQTVTNIAKALDNLRSDWTAVPLTAADRSGPLSLSYQQERLWFLDRLDEQAGAAYHIDGALRLSGPLDTAALQ
ncbi:MAG: amino acid adenylation domain-containing protein, partial [Pseudomonadota bacterium]